MKTQWWKEAVVYQIYPRSFMDSNGDGIGDLQGIISRLDYLKDLGIDVLWLSPIYESPNDDNGYDISNYQEIMREFGTMKDFDDLLSAVHERNMRLIMDLVVNHTSDEHQWFVESRKSKDAEYRDYYIWRPGTAEGPPNNWGSMFGGSAWAYDETTDEYYLHLFSPKQPDLNWDSPRVRKDIFDMMRWWLDKGIDGFRMDVINLISKDAQMLSAPKPEGAKYAWGGQYFTDGPHVHEFLQEMYESVLSKYDIMSVGETGGVTIDQAKLYSGEERRELDMVFQFDHMALDETGNKWNVTPWKLSDLKQVMNRWQNELDGVAWNSLYLNNHDQPRSVSRFGNDTEYRVESAKMLATFLHLHQGTPFIYQGEEIGMTNVALEGIEEYRDLEIHNLWRDRVINGGEEPSVVMKAIHAKGRDNARTPMQWNGAQNGGFSHGEPWIKVNPNYTQINVETAQNDPNSVLNYYKKLIRLRKSHPIMVYGKYRLIENGDSKIYAFTRKLDDELWLVVCNFSNSCQSFETPMWISVSGAETILSTYDEDVEEMSTSLVLKPYEARCYRCKSFS